MGRQYRNVQKSRVSFAYVLIPPILPDRHWLVIVEVQDERWRNIVPFFNNFNLHQMSLCDQFLCLGMIVVIHGGTSVIQLENSAHTMGKII